MHRLDPLPLFIAVEAHALRWQTAVSLCFLSFLPSSCSTEILNKAFSNTQLVTVTQKLLKTHEANRTKFDGILV